MHGKATIFVIIVLFFFNNVSSKPLDIVSGKSGEQQVKEALDRAEKESEQAAKENRVKSTTTKAKQETEEFLSTDKKDSSKDKLTRSTDLKETLDEKVEELAKFHGKHKPKERELHSDFKDDKSSKLIKIDKDEAQQAETKEKENTALEEESDKKMVAMAKKLNNLVLKFQNKMGRLQHKPKTLQALLPQKDAADDLNVKSIRGKPAKNSPIDLAALRNALGLLHVPKPKSEESATKTSYREDTRLEDRLAMEAEEEKKFSNGDSYDDGETGGSQAGTKSSGTSDSSGGTVSSLSPKEQASQEMQSYNALISTESNRELTQIQDEITKATQSSMGQVSVVGQKENVSPELSGLPGLGGIGGLTGGGSSPYSGLGGRDNLNADQFQGLQNGGGLEALQGASAAGNSELPGQQSSSFQQQSTDSAGINPQQMMGGSQNVNIDGGGSQAPIVIGESQTPVEMGTLGTNNPFSSSQSNPMESMSGSQMQNSQFMSSPGQQAPIDIGSNGNEVQQNMAFKKSKITNKRKKNLKKVNIRKPHKLHANNGKRSFTSLTKG